MAKKTPITVATVAERIQYALSVRNMKQSDLVEKTKIPKGSISQYATGYVEPKGDRIKLLAQALDVNPVWLIGFDAPMEVNTRTIALERIDVSKDIAELMISLKNETLYHDTFKEFLGLSDMTKEIIADLIHTYHLKEHPQQ